MKKHVSLILCFCVAICTIISLSSCGEKQKVDVDDVPWEVKMGVNYLERSAVVVKFTNNTEYTITELSLNFSMKDNISEDDLSDYYSYLAEEYNYTEEDINKLKEKKITMRASVNLEEDEYLSEGDTYEDSLLYGYTFIYTMDYYDLFTPNMYKIVYIDENGQECTVYYDYINETYSER